MSESEIDMITTYLYMMNIQKNQNCHMTKLMTTVTTRPKLFQYSLKFEGFFYIGIEIKEQEANKIAKNI